MALVTLQQALESQIARIPLAYLTLCLDCETAWDAREGRACVSCGSGVALSLSRVLDAPRIAPQAPTEAA